MERARGAADGSLVERAGVLPGERSDALRRVAQHPKLAHAAFILETPYDDPRADLKNLNMLRSFVDNE